MKLLVRATNWLGDAVMSIPALREIRRIFPAAQITVLARPWVADLYAGEGFCDRILAYDHKGRHAGWHGKLRLASELRAERFDTAILLQNAFDAALLAWWARIPRRIGYARDGRGFLLTERIPCPEKTAIPSPKGSAGPPLGSVPEEGQGATIPRHERFYYLEMLRRAGLIEHLPQCDNIQLENAGKAAQAGWEQWRKRGLTARRWIGVSPGAAFGGAKRWLPERFAETARVLADDLEADVAVFGSPAEADLCRLVAERAGPRAHCLAGQTSLSEFIQLAATCTLYLTNDSGPMHVAAALGVPTVAIFGATDHVATRPAAAWARIVRQPVDCSPCLLRECPIDHRCMTRVDVDAVVTEGRALLAAASRAQA